MAVGRVKGQEVEILLVVDDAPVETLTDIKDFELEAELEILSEGYLGQTSEQKDEIYKGCKGTMTLHFTDKTPITLMRTVIDRARRRTPGTVINVKATLNFPTGGDRLRISVANAFFGAIPMTFGSRNDYGTIKLEFAAEDFDIL